MSKDINDKRASDSVLSEKEALLAEIKSEYSKEKSETKADESSSTSSDKTSDTEIDEINKIRDNEPQFKDDGVGLTHTIITKTSDPLPRFGKGFIFVPIIVIITIASAILGHLGTLSFGVPSGPVLRYMYIGFGAILLAIGLMLIINAYSVSALNENLKMGKLVTTGVFSRTRNPVYGGVIFICTAVLFFAGNVYTYILPVIYWGLLTFIMKKTEEPLLESRFGREYTDYVDKTYRFMPIPKK